MKNQHKFEIEIGVLYNELKNLLGEKHPFLKRYNYIISQIPDFKKNEIESCFKKEKKLIITYNFDIFYTFLAYKLLVISTHKIKLFLEHYYNEYFYKTNRILFINNIKKIVIITIYYFDCDVINKVDIINIIESWIKNKDYTSNINTLKNTTNKYINQHHKYNLNIKEIYEGLKETTNNEHFLKYFRYTVELIPEFTKDQKYDYFFNDITLIVTKKMISYSFFLALKLLISPLSETPKIISYHYNNYSVENKISNFIIKEVFMLYEIFKSHILLLPNKKKHILKAINNWINENIEENTFNKQGYFAKDIYIEDTNLKQNKIRYEEKKEAKIAFEITIPKAKKKHNDKIKNNEKIDPREYDINDFFIKSEKFVKNLDYSNNFDHYDYSFNYRYEIELGNIYLEFINKYGNIGTMYETLSDLLKEHSSVFDNRHNYAVNNIEFLLSKRIVYPFHYIYDDIFFYKLLVINKKIIPLFLNYQMKKYHINKEKAYINFISQIILHHFEIDTEIKEYIYDWLSKKEDYFDVFNDKSNEVNNNKEIFIEIFNLLSENFASGKKHLDVKKSDINYICRKIISYNNIDYSFSDYNRKFEWNSSIKNLSYLFYLFKTKYKLLNNNFNLLEFITSTFKIKENKINKKSINRYLQDFSSYANNKKPKNATFYDNLIRNTLNTNK